MKGPLTFLALLAVIIIGLGIWVATPDGGGGVGEDGPAGGAGGVSTPGFDDASDRSEGSVEIVGDRFKPSTVEVVGQPNVTFINRDDVAHRVDFEDKAVKDSKEIPPGEAYVAELPREGRYKFSDPNDKAMKGTVVVSGG